MKQYVSIFFFVMLSFNLFSQHKIRENDILFKQSITRSIPLAYADNKRVFGDNNRLVKVLLDAYSRGLIDGYQTNEFIKKVSYCQQIQLIKPEYLSEETDEVSTSFFGQVELLEDIIFDNKHSDVILSPQGITIMISPEFSKHDLLQPLVSFKFDDCTRIFKNDSRAYSINPQWNGRNINFNEVFLMHLYSSYITKMGGPTDSYFDQMKADKMQAFLYGKAREEELQNYLYKLFNPR